MGGARARHGQPSLSQGHSGRRRGTQRGWQASAAAHAFAEEGETGEGRAVGARQPRAGRQRTSQPRPPAQSAGVSRAMRQLRSQREMLLRRERRSTFSGQGACPASPGRKVDLRCGRCHAGRTLQKERATCVDAEISLLMRKALKKSDPRTQCPGLTSGGGQTYWGAGEKCSAGTSSNSLLDVGASAARRRGGGERKRNEMKK